nr:serine hydrolase [Thiorhodococcus mannitoliphagus]
MATLLMGSLVLVATACATDSSERAYSSTYRPSNSSPEVSAYRSSYQRDQTLNQFGDSGRIDRLDRLQGVDRTPAGLDIRTPSALIVDDRGNRIYAKNTQRVRPIASVTKLMTAMVVLDAGVSMKTPISIIENDRDTLKNSRSRLRIGKAVLPRDQMMMVALMSSDNRAAHALSRTTFRGGTETFVRAMNRKAKALGMKDTTFVDATGLNPRNRSTAEDMVKMVRAASRYAFIRQTTSRGEMVVYPFADGTPLQYRNTNRLVRGGEWSIDVSKTGFINEAGRCLVMQTNIGSRRLTIVLLGASGKLTPMADSERLRDWMLSGNYTTASR